MKNGKSNIWFPYKYIKYGKFLSVLLGHFIKHIIFLFLRSAETSYAYIALQVRLKPSTIVYEIHFLQTPSTFTPRHLACKTKAISSASSLALQEAHCSRFLQNCALLNDFQEPVNLPEGPLTQSPFTRVLWGRILQTRVLFPQPNIPIPYVPRVKDTTVTEKQKIFNIGRADAHFEGTFESCFNVHGYPGCPIHKKSGIFLD